MSGLDLFLRARRTYTCLLVVLFVSAVQRPIGHAEIKLGANKMFALPWVVIVPALAGAIAGSFTGSAMHTWERGSPRPIRSLRAAVALAPLGAFAGITLWATAGLDGDYSTASCERNALLFFGLTWISACAFGTKGAGILPMLYALLCLVGGIFEGKAAAWAWAVQQADHPDALGASIALAVLGLACFLLVGPRTNPRDDME